MLFILLLSLVTADLTNYKSGLEYDFIVDVRKNVGNFLEERPSANSFHISELKNFEELRTLKCLKAKIGVQGWEKGEEVETEKTVQTLKDLGFENVKDLGVFSGGQKGFNADSSTDEMALPECVEKRIRDEPKYSEEKDFDEKKKDFLESKTDSEEDLIKFYQLIKQEMKDKKEKSFSSSSEEEENLDLERFFDFFLENSSEDSEEGEDFDFGALKENIFGKIKEHVSEFSEKNLKETHDVFKAWISGEKTMDEVREYLGKKKKDGKDRSRGEGKDMSQGEGKDRSQGEGKDMSRGEGKDMSRGEGKDMSRGEGKDRSRGEGKDMSRGEGKDRSRGEGKDRSRGEGKDMSRGGEHHSGEGKGKDRSRGDGKRHSGEGKNMSRGEGKHHSQGDGKHHSGEGKDRSRGEGRPHSRGEGRQHSKGRGKHSGSRSDSSSSEEDESYNEDSDFFPDWPESKGEKRHHDDHSRSHSEEDAEMSVEDFRHMEGRDGSGHKGGKGRGRGGRGGHKNGEKDKGKNGKGKESKGYSKDSSEEMEYDARGFNLYESDNERHHRHHHHSKDDKKKYGFIAVIGGSVLGFCVIVACLYCFCRSRKAKVISTDQKIGEDSYSEEYEEVCEVKVHFEDKKDVVADMVTKDDGTTNTTLYKLSGTTKGLGGENSSSILVE